MTVKINIMTNLIRKPPSDAPQSKTFGQRTVSVSFTKEKCGVHDFTVSLDSIGLIYCELKFHMDSQPWPTLGCGFLYDRLSTAFSSKRKTERGMGNLLWARVFIYKRMPPFISGFRCKHANSRPEKEQLTFLHWTTWADRKPHFRSSTTITVRGNK